MERQLQLLDENPVDWRLDDDTRETGRIGIETARAALAAAHRSTIAETKQTQRAA